MARCDGPKATTGGFELKALKKLNGDRLALPRASIVPTSAIGRGATPERKILCNSRGDISLGVKDFMEEKIMEKDVLNGHGIKILCKQVRATLLRFFERSCFAPCGDTFVVAGE